MFFQQYSSQCHIPPGDLRNVQESRFPQLQHKPMLTSRSVFSSGKTEISGTMALVGVESSNSSQYKTGNLIFFRCVQMSLLLHVKQSPKDCSSIAMATTHLSINMFRRFTPGDDNPWKLYYSNVATVAVLGHLHHR